MKRKLLFIASMFFYLFFLCTTLSAQEILEKSAGWDKNPWGGSVGIEFNPSGKQVTIKAQGNTSTDTWGAWEKEAQGIDGIIGSIRIKKLQGEGAVIFRKYLGTIENHYIQALVMVGQFGGKKIRWIIRERDENQHNIRILAQGTFGEDLGEWKEGDTITLGLARVGEEVWFYVDGYKCFLKWQPFTKMGPPVLKTGISAYIPQGDPSQFMEAEVSNVQLLDIQ